MTVTLPVTLSLAVLRRFWHATTGYVDRPQAAMGSRHWRSPLRSPAGDPTPITLVKGMYSGKIKSLDRDPGIATLDPGMPFPGN